eukprot:scaffold5087_cov125-Isochrysis_galbana.AAC.2
MCAHFSWACPNIARRLRRLQLTADSAAAEQPLGFLVGGSWAAAQPRLLRAQGPTPLCVF